MDSGDVTFYSNRSACYAALGRWQEAAEDGRQCIITDRTFVKGYFRQALGLQNMGNLDGALEAVKRGLGIDSQNADLKKMSREIEESQRMKKVEGFITATEMQLKDNDVGSAFKSCEAGLRLDPENKSLNSLMARVRPLYERAEKQRLSNLDPKERLKEEGDSLFKAAKFEEAIKTYTRCLDSMSDKVIHSHDFHNFYCLIVEFSFQSSELALKCYNNRAACYKQLSNFDGVIGDSTAVLEYKSDDIKALMRRAQAYEACERYKSALQDVRQVLAYGIDVVGKPTYDLANGMQHRLNRVIAQLRG